MTKRKIKKLQDDLKYFEKQIEKERGKEMLMEKKLIKKSVFMRHCKRCEGIYKTTSKRSRVCSNCNEGTIFTQYPEIVK